MSASPSSFAADLAALAWQVELGADEAIGEAPVNRFDVPAAARARRRRRPRGRVAAPRAPVAEARGAGGAGGRLRRSRGAPGGDRRLRGLGARRGARNLVFADGDPAARVMVIGEAPGRDEDRDGPAVRRSFGAAPRPDAGGDRAVAAGRGPGALGAYITNVLPWRPPQNRDPSGDEAALLAAVPLPPHRAGAAGGRCCSSARRRSAPCSPPATG